MSKKLLVVTAGTVAAGVGQTILKQMRAHPGSDLNVMVRYIDTAFLPSRYGSIRPSEWFQMSIDPRYMRALYNNIDSYPNLQKMLFTGLLPGTDVSGGGSIRYNGAGAVEVKRDDLQEWLSASMTSLAQSGDGDTNISLALIVSAVGATGSGSLEHLIDVIVDAAHFAGIRSTAQSTIRCDIYILQPSQEVTDLGLANTLALYAELAASQLSRDDTNKRSYQGRKIMIGWGSNRALSSIEQLKEVAATIIRLSSDPTSAFAAEFQEREVDNHVLRELDPLTNLPMHLSLVTAVTINLGRLEEQVIQRDITRLVNSLVFDTTTATNQANLLLGKFADALSGERAEDRYQKLLEHLSDAIGLNKMRSRLDTTVASRGIPVGEKGSRLAGLWQEYKAEIKQGRHKIQDFGGIFTSDSLKELERIKGERICKGGISLTVLREEYRSLQDILASTLEVARADTRTTVNDSPVIRQQQALEAIWPFRLLNRTAKLRRLANAMKRNLQEYLRESTRSSAIEALEELEQYCAEIGRDLDVVLGKLRRQRDDDQRMTTTSNFSVDSGNPLSLVALSNTDEMSAYADQVSIFSAHARGEDQLAEFRQWLQGRVELEALFKGNLDLLLGVVNRYVKERVHEAIQSHSVIDVLQRAGEDTLRRRLSEAAARATALVTYSEDFARNRRQAWHVSAYYRNEDQREEIQHAINDAFAQGQCKLLSSNDPAEVAIFYYVDGVPMSAIGDLKGRCLNAFLRRRQQWHKQKASLNGSAPSDSIGSFNQEVGVPIFSGSDAEQRVQEMGIIRRLYGVRGPEVNQYSVRDIPELGDLPSQAAFVEQTNHHNQGNGTNGAQTVFQPSTSDQVGS